MEDEDTDLRPLMDLILQQFPAPKVDLDGPFQMLVSNILYSDYVGRIAVGRIARGKVDKDLPLLLLKDGGAQVRGKATKLIAFEGVKQADVSSAEAGDIIGLAGFEDVFIGDTLCFAEAPEALERIHVDEPTLSMTFGVNTSPLAGTEGKFVTARHLKARLEKELLSNLALRVEQGPGGGGESFVVSGRGELHLGILIETMRREGFELEVGKPKVIFRKEEGRTLEPFERLIIDVPSVSMGGVIERLGQRKAEMINMTPFGDQTRLEFLIPSRCLLGFRTEFLTITRGEGALHHIFENYAEYSGEGASRSRGVLWATDPGESNGYGLYQAQERGSLFIGPQEKVYAGMIVGENSRENDLGVNITKAKQLTNMRASGSDEALVLTPPRRMSLEQCLEYIEDDELVEVTPLKIRLRKKILDATQRKRAEKSLAGV
jgi:GTP-binding protein